MIGGDEILEVLSDLERREARLLTWGFVDGAMPEDEILGAIAESISRYGGDASEADAVLDRLLELKFVVEARDAPGSAYRTRMAESVRLFARLRQWLRGGKWTTSPSLVSDFRLDLRPRAFPRRVRPAQECLAALEASDLSLQAGEALLAGSDGHPARDLAEFQQEAAERILSALRLRRTGGTIVTAGTGSGKTLAFYLPTLMWLAGEVGQTAAARVLAIYPRNELLKDQLAQCLSELDRLRGVGARPIRISALFGPMPWKASDVEGGQFSRPWQIAGSGRVCPYVSCPRCGGPLIWPDEDRNGGVELLRCGEVKCDYETEEGQFALTREGLRRQPADLLFTTTEMVNRLMSDPSYYRVLGVRSSPRPALMLLDEVHTYGGLSGAQAALLLRRWHSAAGGKVHFVGLSATLRDAVGFFSSLVGLREDQTRAIAPRPSELDHRGMEYCLALRSNPVSGAAVLSTTIQVLMLGGRILDPRVTEGSAFGSRVFAFSDTLDVINRLFAFLKDAEGRSLFNDQRRRESLASLRTPETFPQDDLGNARHEGQAWDLPMMIGHDLQNGHLSVGVTTSQRAGVDESDVIVATGALEVGYNDDRVGLVVQHKAPRDSASFIQRRGRAGRQTHQRPWSIVVLSDFGRDRLAYQAYEQLFEPIVPRRRLPVSNQAVVKMQATYATLDWLATRRSSRDSVWRNLTAPGKGDQNELADLIELVLRTDAERRDLAEHLRQSLDLSEEQVTRALWGAPRGIITEVLPTALRRLRSNWNHVDLGPGKDLQAKTSPLPDFVPPNLFSELQLPEVQLDLPGREEPESLSLTLCLSEFAPGNVSFRYAHAGRKSAAWVPPEDGGGGQSLDLGTFLEQSEELPSESTDRGTTRVFRPWQIQTREKPADISDSSRGRLCWEGGPRPASQGAAVDLPDGTPWGSVIKDVTSYLHSLQSHVKVRRWAPQFSAEIGEARGRKREKIDRSFSYQGEPAAVGFDYFADALSFKIEIPGVAGRAPTKQDPVRLRSFRAAWFAQRIAKLVPGAEVSVFQTVQLGRAYVAALLDEAMANNCDLEASRDSMTTKDLSNRFTTAARTLYTPADAALGPARGLDELLSLTQDSAVLAAFDQGAKAIWAEFDEDAQHWAGRRFISTLAAAIVDASQGLCPEFDLDNDIVVDIERENGTAVVWLSETSPGGGGVVEALQHRMVARPRQFMALLDKASRPSDFELVDAALEACLEKLRIGNSPFGDALDEFETVRRTV